MGLFSKLFSAPSKAPMIERVIAHMSRQPSYMGTAYDEISYEDVVDYITERNLEVVSTTDKGSHVWYNFIAPINGKHVEVYLDKTPGGRGSVLTVPPAE